MVEMAGLKWVADDPAPNRITAARVRPIGIACPELITTERKIKVPMNSVIRSSILFFI
jgi:hypothetical protein